MTEKNPPVFIQAGSHPAEDVRRIFDIFVGVGSSGYVSTGDLAVSESGTPAMSVSVAAGRALIQGTESNYSGVYAVENRLATTLTVTAANASNPRIDVVVAKIQDQAYSGSVNAWSLAVVDGTPASSPTAPAIPANSLKLAEVAVAAASSAVLNANITDHRVRWKDAYRVGGTDVAVADGGTGSSTALAARAALGLTISSDVQAYSAVLDATTASFTTVAESKLAAIEAGADVTDATNVTAAGAFMASGVSAFGATLVDDADAATARTTLAAQGSTITDANGYLLATTVDGALDELAEGEYFVDPEGSVTGTKTLSSAPALTATMTGDTTFTFATPSTAGKTFLLYLAGAFVPTWPASVDWADGAEVTYATPTIYTFVTFDTGTTWFGSSMGSAFA
jgi:hypothetical protein